MSGGLWGRLNNKANEAEPKVQPSAQPTQKVSTATERTVNKEVPQTNADRKEQIQATQIEKKVEPAKKDKPANSLKRTSMKKEEFLSVKLVVQDSLLEEFSASDLKTRRNDEAFKKEVQRRIKELVDEQRLALTLEQKAELTETLLHDIIGFGPLERLLEDESISEIMVNHANQVYVEQNGKLILTDIFFDDNDQILKIADRIVSPLNRHIDESSPYVDARLPDGSRVNIIIPPLALKGPCITIRKFAKDALTIAKLVQFGTVSEPMALFIEACVRARLNIVVSGGTGSGKTTTLNVLSSFIPSDERIVTIEDAAELQLRQDHVISLESRPASSSGANAVPIRTLVANSLRMRPDRIVVGECRAGEALDMLQAMNTGHDGSMTTGHANTPRDMLARLETMVLMSGMDLPVRAIREQIASAVDVIVQQSRLKDGSRKITHITEVQHMEGDNIVLQDIFTFNQTGIDENGKIIGELKSTGIRPAFMKNFELYGIELPAEIFKTK